MRYIPCDRELFGYGESYRETYCILRNFLYFLYKKAYTIDNNIEHTFALKERRNCYE